MFREVLGGVRQSNVGVRFGIAMGWDGICLRFSGDDSVRVLMLPIETVVRKLEASKVGVSFCEDKEGMHLACVRVLRLACACASKNSIASCMCSATKNNEAFVQVLRFLRFRKVKTYFSRNEYGFVFEFV